MARNMKFEKASEDWPRTNVLKDGGIAVTAPYLDPATPKRTDFVFGVLTLLIPIYVLVSTGDVAAAGIVFAVVLVASWLILRPLSHTMLSKKLNLKMYPDRIEIPGRWGVKRYSRAEPIEFRVDDHQKAIKEQIYYPQYSTYRNALEVIMQYGEKRIPIAEMHIKELEKARALVIRLQNICDQFDEALNRLLQGQMSEAEPARGDFGPAPDIR